MYRKLLTTLSISLLFLGVLSACASLNSAPSSSTSTAVAPPAATQPSLTKVTIALGYIPDVQFTPFYIALRKGYYKDEGLDVTFKHGIVPDLIKELGQGQTGINFAVASGDEIIPARLQGIPAVYVATWYRRYPVAAASILGKGPTLQSPADLKGKVVGVPGLYGSTYIGLQALLKAGNLTLNDIQLKTIDFTQVASLTQGQVQVAMVYSANEPVQMTSQGLDVSLLQVADYANLASNGLATNEQTLKDNPQLVGKVVRATLKGVKDTIDDPVAAFNVALQEVPEIGGNNKDLQLKVLQATTGLMQAKPGDTAVQKPLGWTDPSVWSATQDFLYEIKVITQKGDVNQMFTNQFVTAPGQ